MEFDLILITRAQARAQEKVNIDDKSLGQETLVLCTKILSKKEQ